MDPFIYVLVILAFVFSALSLVSWRRTRREIAERNQAETRIRLAAAHAETLARVVARLNAQLDLDTLLMTATEETARALNTPASAVSLYDDKQRVLVYAAAFGLPPGSLTGAQPLPRPLYDQLVQRRETLIVLSDAQAYTGMPENGMYKTLNVRTILAAAMTRGGQLIGSLDALTLGQTRYFSSDEISLLQEIAGQAAQAVANARLFSESLRRMENLVALYSSAQKLTHGLNLQELAEDVVRTCVNAFNVQLAWLGRAEPNGQVRSLAHFPVNVRHPSQINVRWDDTSQGQGPSGRAIRSGFPVVIANLNEEAETMLWRTALVQGFQTSAAFPLISRDRPFGVLNLYSDQAGFFTPERVQFLQSFVNQAAAALENARLLEEAERSAGEFSVLYETANDLALERDLPRLLQAIVERARQLLNATSSSIFLYNPARNDLELVVEKNLGLQAGTRMQIGEGFVGRVAKTGQPMIVENYRAWPGRAAQFATLGLAAVAGVPMIHGGQLIGVLAVAEHGDSKRKFAEADSRLLTLFAAQAASAVFNAQLLNDLQRSNAELAMAYDLTLEGWSNFLDLKDRETEGHSRRVTEMTLRLAQAMGIHDANALLHVRRGALLHDIGKMGIPDSILLKAEELTDEEWAVMRLHPVYAYNMLSPITFLRPALDIPYCHHERWDGTGYPRNLKGEQIPLAARIFAVVDVWDALRFDRPYRQGWPEEKVRAHLGAGAGAHFDPQVVEAFLKLQASEV